MKVIWEEEDIVVGRKYSKAGISEVWMLGYHSDLERDDRYTSISLEDGMILPPQTKTDIALNLTNGDYLPIELLENK